MKAHKKWPKETQSITCIKMYQLIFFSRLAIFSTYLFYFARSLQANMNEKILVHVSQSLNSKSCVQIRLHCRSFFLFYWNGCISVRNTGQYTNTIQLSWISQVKTMVLYQCNKMSRFQTIFTPIKKSATSANFYTILLYCNNQ